MINDDVRKLLQDLGIELQVAERYERFIQLQWPLLAEVGEPDRSDIIECGRDIFARVAGIAEASRRALVEGSPTQREIASSMRKYAQGSIDGLLTDQVLSRPTARAFAEAMHVELKEILHSPPDSTGGGFE